MTAREKLIKRMQERNEQLKQAQNAARQIEQLIGAVNECAGLLIDEYEMKQEEIQELLK